LFRPLRRFDGPVTIRREVPMRASTLVVFVAVLPALPVRADAVDCEDRAVFTGQSTVDLLSKCGEPSQRDERVDERATLVFDPSRQVSELHKIRVLVAHWTYDFGPTRFLQFVTIENGTVVAVETGGYGSAVAAPIPERASIARCDPQRSFHVGDNTYEILSRCGEPSSRDFKQVERHLAAADTDGLVYAEFATVDVETWTYNFGPQAFQRRLKFTDGKLVKIATGTYGYR
jgi:Protein of unknown function (DUF2845)